MIELHFPKVHPVIRKFPAMAASELDALTADISKNGQRRPIALYQGHVWDGRARLEACRRLAIQPRYWLLRRTDPILFLIGHNEGFGSPKSPERRAALAVFDEMRGSDAAQREQKRRSEWIAEARQEFRLSVRRPQPCAVCDRHIEMVHAHHSLPLSIQYELGLTLANQDHYWLCPVHHVVLHTYISIYITCTKPGAILDHLRPEHQEAWLKAENVFSKGSDLFKRYGGLSEDVAAWNDKYPHLAIVR